MSKATQLAELITKNEHVYLCRRLCTLGLVKSSVTSDSVKFVKETKAWTV